VSLDDILIRELAALDAQNLRRSLRLVGSPQDAVIELDGRRVVNFSSNNYLGLANHPALRLRGDFGAGAGASRLIVGNLRPHRDLELALAEFHGAPAALFFTSGYQANVGVLQALAGPEDVIFSDALNHASIIDGCRLSRARVEVYQHNDPADLERRFLGSPGRRRFVVTDTLYSMDGDLAPLRELRALCDQHQAYLIADEAHSTGVLGPGGRGLAAALGVRLDVHVATLGKALGTFGAYVIGSQALIDTLINRARSFIFTTAPPPGLAATARAAVALAASAEGDRLRRQLDEHVAALRDGLRARGLLAAGAGHSPIFPIILGDERRALTATQALLGDGIYVQAIRPPTVPVGTSRLRISVMATHTAEHITALLAAIDRLDLPRGAP
jgi:8-amino-7-oxononanoate synthase